jgi:hypothetical protein
MRYITDRAEGGSSPDAESALGPPGDAADAAGGPCDAVETSPTGIRGRAPEAFPNVGGMSREERRRRRDTSDARTGSGRPAFSRVEGR